MREILRFGLLLGMFCALSAGTLTAVYSKVIVKIEENNRLEAIKKRKTVLDDAEDFRALEKDERTVHVGVGAGGEAVGTALTLSRRGYAGPIGMTLGLDGEGKIRGLAISKLDQSETPGLGVKICFPSFLDQFRGLELERVKLKNDGGEIDAITAATISSRAVVEGVREGMEWYFRTFPEGVELPPAPPAPPAPPVEGGTGTEGAEGGEPTDGGGDAQEDAGEEAPEGDRGEG